MDRIRSSVVGAVVIVLLAIAMMIGCGDPEVSIDAGGDARDGGARDSSMSEPDAARGEHDDASMGIDGAVRDGGVTDAAPRDAVDCFGTRVIEATIAGGREWCLPADPTGESGAWRPHGDAVGAGSEAGALLSDGSPRHSVVSPEGEAWWRNVEMTVYVRWLEGDAGEEFTLYARGDRHTRGAVETSDINEGVAAPAGTETWPGYPFASAVPHECLGTAYKASLAIDGSAFFRKEISHTDGYTDRAAEEVAIPGGLTSGAWVGIKMILRNADEDRAVHLELWVDREADGRWEQITTYDDRGGWEGDPASDGCDEAPLGYAQDQIISWAGPIAVLRADAQRFELRAFSIREIAPLP